MNVCVGGDSKTPLGIACQCLTTLTEKEGKVDWLVGFQVNAKLCALTASFFVFADCIT